jgi:hypothetical protein
MGGDGSRREMKELKSRDEEDLPTHDFKHD